ncbi:MAG: hypothetical protein H6730_02390 [Deltaproteobacteria bacterium]|nr:hypothetical protein [Deltaproteobacteria bacterium]
MIGLVAAAGCRGGELPADVPWVTAPDHLSHEQYFPINSGKHEGIDCNKCHGDFDTFTEFTCISCHTHAQTETDPAHAAVPDYTYERKSCFTCHPRGEADGAGVAHDAFYPIGPGTAHEPLACSSCHVDPSTRSVVSCIDCHDHDEAPMATQHGGTPGYAWETQACIGCHRDGDALSRDVHDAIFPVSETTAHGSTACAECHVDPADREAVTCVDCHAHEVGPSQTAHQLVGGYAYVTSDCMKCHYDSSVPRIAQHLPFRIDGEAKHKAENAACLECHTQVQANRPFPSADFGAFDCLGCHLQPETDAAHQGEADYRYASGACVMCHDDGEAGAISRIEHDPIFPVSAATAHGNTACADCHVDASNRENVTCVNCHAHQSADMSTAHTAVGGYRYDTALCEKCHYDSSVFRVSRHQPFRITATSKHRPSRAECLECHPQVLPNRPFPSANFEPFDCLGCHGRSEMDGQHRGRTGYAYDSPTCVKSGCHPTGDGD